MSQALYQLSTYNNWELILNSVLAGGTFRGSGCCWSGTEVCLDDLSVLGHGNGTGAQNLSVKTPWEREGWPPSTAK